MQPIRCFWLEKTGKEEKDGAVTRPIYRRVDTGEEMTWHAAPLGAMLDCSDWYKNPDYVPPDGRYLAVKVPGNANGSGQSYWIIDGPSSNNQAPVWTRTGEPPNITVNPSIFISPPNGFHGWLKDGVITSV